MRHAIETAAWVVAIVSSFAVVFASWLVVAVWGSR
jgi:hypothetical protein